MTAMTGPQHVHEAAELLARADHRLARYETNPDQETFRHLADHLANRAQVHATLALIAVIARPPQDRVPGDPEWVAWLRVLGAPIPAWCTEPGTEAWR